jgi:hypothetical protein
MNESVLHRSLATLISDDVSYSGLLPIVLTSACGFPRPCLIRGELEVPDGHEQTKIRFFGSWLSKSITVSFSLPHSCANFRG